MNAPDDHHRLSTSAAAAFLGVTRHAIHWFVRIGRLHPVPGVVTANGQFFFFKVELRRFDEERRGLRLQRWDLWTVKPNMLRAANRGPRATVAIEQRSATGRGRR